MALVKRRSRYSSLPSLFEDFFNRDPFDFGNGDVMPAGSTVPMVNISETDSDFEVEMAAPGMEKGDFKIELDDNTLTISGEKKTSSEKKEGKGYRREFNYQSFERSFLLPKEVVDEDKIEAHYDKGILHLRIPKREEARQKGPRMIDIS